ncbi:phosphoglycerol transferase MdoB-like AlkP superfamily enzyme [Agrobacterium larrymoorei]|uniref:Phosphoglycerol transferase MdoB-like AlkP superfamily enzyme n=2 Tax=Agrobacterium larrymoorei TaxID=160699 RepID=A0ABU0ULP3_9HYPH|nr:phosphoglycerol transferase MdoB-like AlkP superfamily enzyme [Agrobacterium larrymoorei]
MTKSVPKTTVAERMKLVLSKPWTRSPARFANDAQTLINLVLAAVLLVVCMEWIARGTLHDVGSFLLSPARPGLTTIVTVVVGLMALDALFGRHYQSLLVAVPLLILPAFISSQKQLYLSDPLYPSDLLFGRQILQLLPAMLRAQPLTAIALAAALALAAFGMVMLWRLSRHAMPVMPFKARMWRLALAVPLFVGFGSMMEYSSYSWIRDRLNIIPMMWDQKENYRHNGFIMAFAFNIPMAKVTAPYGYGEATIADIPSDSSAFAVNHSKRPDVIMIMSESLWDPTRLENVTLSKDPMPRIRAMQSGHVFSPEFGGMTANVEFEALTGFSNAFLPYGSIPYQQYVRRPVPSLATFFRSEGYSAIAVHPFQEWFWNRREVYKHFGFEEFRSEETLPPMEKRGAFASDEALTNEIIQTVDAAEKPQFLFAVTLQGHGPYEANRYAEKAVSVSGDLSDNARDALATYAQGVSEADDSFAKLIAWAKGRERETVIVLFGDHLPPLGQAFVESGYMPGMVATRRAPLVTMKKEHETPLVVWSSKAGLQNRIGTISPSLLPYHILKTAGFDDPFYTGVLGKVHASYSVIDRHMLMERNGSAVPDWSIAPATVPSALSEYRQLQFDMMFGDQFGKERFFPGFNWIHETTPSG